MKNPILNNLANPSNFLVMFGVSFIMFDLNYLMMKNLPGTRDNMCVPGAGLTGINILFSILMSVLIGVMIVGVIELFKMKKSKVVGGSSLSALGLFFGTFTVFCTACTLPVISVFGLSLSLTFFTDYDVAFKLLSLILILAGMWMLNGQLKNECVLGCEISK